MKPYIIPFQIACALWNGISVCDVWFPVAAGSIHDWDKDKYVTKMVVKVPKNATYGSTEIWEHTPDHDEEYKKLVVTGWSTTKNGKKLSASYRFTKNITLYPVWGKNTNLYTAMVTNGGSLYGYPCNRPYVIGYSKGSTIALPTKAEIEREGYTFVGWYLDAAFKKKITNTKKFKVTANRYIYARWKKN